MAFVKGSEPVWRAGPAVGRAKSARPAPPAAIPAPAEPPAPALPSPPPPTSRGSGPVQATPRRFRALPSRAQSALARGHGIARPTPRTTARRSRSSRNTAPSAAIGTRACSIESRSRIVTLPSPASPRSLSPDRLHVDGDAVGRADLVLAPIEPADGRRVVVDDAPVPGELGADRVRRAHDIVALLEQRQHRDLDRRQLGVEAQHDPLLATDLLLAIGVGEEGQQRAVDPGRGSMTKGTTCSLRSSSKYVSDLPLNFACCLRSKSVRLAMPISSLQPMGNRYSMSTVRLA